VSREENLSLTKLYKEDDLAVFQSTAGQEFAEFHDAFAVEDEFFLMRGNESWGGKVE
jgi:hypothetical protein